MVASLPKIKVDAEQLQQLGGPGTACPVCTEQLVEGDEVQLLPCKHVFHPPCLAPWLAGVWPWGVLQLVPLSLAWMAPPGLQRVIACHMLG